MSDIIVNIYAVEITRLTPEHINQKRRWVRGPKSLGDRRKLWGPAGKRGPWEGIVD